MTVKEDRSGEKDKLITYFKISEEYVDAKYSTNEFPSNSIIYLTNCHSFNSNNNLPEVFNNKGVCAVVGWNSQQGLGGYHGFLLYNSMLSFDINLSTAFLTDYIIDIPPVMSHGCTFLGWEIDQCNLLNISACVDYYPDSGGSVKFNLENNSNFPSLNTSIITNITKISAQAGGTITDDGGSQISEKGVCWSTLQNPTIIDSHTSDGTGMGSFTSQITGLTPNTPYIVRAYATNSSGTAYGDEKSFTTLPEAPPSGGLVPLAVGNYWIYQPEGLPQTETASILGSQEVQGVTCFEWFAQGDTYSYLLTNKSDGVWCYGYGPYQLPPDLRYKYPVQVNDTWISYWVAPPYATTVTCLSTNASIGGYTDCILYNFYLPLAYHSMQTSSFVFQDKIDSFEGLNKTSSGFDIYDYYIPGIGMVGWETYLDGTLFVKAVLVDYQFNQ